MANDVIEFAVRFRVKIKDVLMKYLDIGQPQGLDGGIGLIYLNHGEIDAQKLSLRIGAGHRKKVASRRATDLKHPGMNRRDRVHAKKHCHRAEVLGMGKGERSTGVGNLVVVVGLGDQGLGHPILRKKGKRGLSCSPEVLKKRSAIRSLAPRAIVRHPRPPDSRSRRR